MKHPAKLITACGTVYRGTIVSGERPRTFKGTRKIIIMFEIDTEEGGDTNE